MPRRITPVTTRSIGYDPDPHGEVPPPVTEQVATLTAALETMLTTPTDAPARQAALVRVRALMTRLGLPMPVVAQGGGAAGSALTQAAEETQ